MTFFSGERASVVACRDMQKFGEELLFATAWTDPRFFYSEMIEWEML